MFTIWRWACAFLLLCGSILRAESLPDGAEPWVLRTADGDEYLGIPVTSSSPDLIPWQSPTFVQPLDFHVRFLSSLQRVNGWESQRATGQFCVELSGGDVLYGELSGWDEQYVELQTKTLGTLRIDRNAVANLYRWDDGKQMIYSGPNGLQEWQNLGDPNACLMDRGHLVIEKPETSLLGNIQLPQQCRVDLEIAWSSKPNFVVAFGVSTESDSWRTAPRLEVWEDSIVLLRESAERADIAEVGKAAAFFGELKLTLLFDLSRGRAIVYRENGEVLANVEIDPNGQPLGTKLLLQNLGGPLRLKKLRVIDGATVPSARDPVTTPQVFRTDGTTIPGSVSRYDSSSHELVVAAAQGEVQLPVAQLQRVFPGVIDSPKTSVPVPEQPKSPDAPATITVMMRDGVQIKGRLQGLTKAGLQIRSSTIRDAVDVPWAQTVSVTGNLLEKTATSTAKGRVGELQADQLKSKGFLAGVPEEKSDSPVQNPLVWQPLASQSASPLRTAASARIVYREPDANIRLVYRDPNADRRDPAMRQIGNVPPQVAKVPLPTISGQYTIVDEEPRRRAIYLRNGDVIPCEIKEIDEKGVHFESTATKATFIPHDAVKAAELSTARDPTRLSPEKLKRLLMLPRMQRKFPPTHLIVSNAGDYLRGNVVSLGEADLTIEVRQETITVPRIGLSHIIWFHADELPSQERTKGDRAIPPNATSTPPAELVSDSPADSEPAAGKPGLVQAICRNGVRMTFRPEQASLKALMGTSKLLDVCYVAIEDIDLLLLGKELDAYQEKGEYSGWRWNFAPDPQVLSESSEDDPGRQAGMESTLVGQLAPEFSLQTLDESWFKLSEHRGKILLLDFWASWCGPCVQSMPQIDTLMADYPAEEVLLVTVNLQESPAQINALLERLKIAPQVLLDETGLVAEAYGAKAIPQTVLIDRDGVVARVFVGGGPKLPGQLKEAIDQLRSQAIKAP